ncbi:MAG: acyl-CoA thioesterase [Acidimicrobiales bacterium]
MASQSLRATTLTVDDDRAVHSLHSYFIRPGRPGVPLHLGVERIRDGRSFSTRRVTARQGDEAIFVLDASFHVIEDGFDWQVDAPEDLAQGPDDVPNAGGWMGTGRRPPWVRKGDTADDTAGDDAPADERPKRGPLAAVQFDLRPLRMSEDFTPHPAWVRILDPIGDDPAMHACALTYVSDLAVVRSARAPGSTDGGWGGASLDHAVWFHRPFRADDWLLFSVDPLTNHGARGLARGSFHTTDGVLVASFVQECLLRSTGMPPPP